MAELHFEGVGFYGHRVDVLAITDRTVEVTTAYWDHFQLLTLVFPEDFGQETRVSESQR